MVQKPALTILLLLGEQSYGGPADAMDAPSDLIPAPWKENMHLIDLSGYSDEELLLILKHICDPEIMAVLSELVPYMQQIEKEMMFPPRPPVPRTS